MDMTVRRDHALLDLDAAAGPHDPAAGRPFVILGAGFTDHSGNAQLAGVRGGDLHLNILAQRPQNGDLGDAALGALDLYPLGIDGPSHKVILTTKRQLRAGPEQGFHILGAEMDVAGRNIDIYFLAHGFLPFCHRADPAPIRLQGPPWQSF